MGSEAVRLRPSERFSRPENRPSRRALAARVKILCGQCLSAPPVSRTVNIAPLPGSLAPDDTTVQPKDITFPTDAKLLHAAIKGLTRLARKRGVRLRQSYVRIAKRAAMMAGRYAHAKQFNRHRRQ